LSHLSYIGEYGAPENAFTEKQIKMVQVALDKKCPSVHSLSGTLHGPKPDVKPPSWSNTDFRDWWFIRADGSKPMLGIIFMTC